MRVPLSWLSEYVALPAGTSGSDLAERLIAAGFEVEAVEPVGHDITGPLLVGRVASFTEETHSNGKTIRWCQVEVGSNDEPRGIVCGARNFAEGDLVVTALPGAVLPGDFAIGARKTYGHVSDGMICSVRELGIGEDHVGILVLDPGAAAPGDDAAALLDLRDEVLDIAVTPDRGYALSLRGVAREAAIAYGLDFTDPVPAGAAEPGTGGYPIRVDDPVGCPVFAARTVTGFDPAAPSPAWLQRRVRLAGMRPISLAVDVTNYVMLEVGHPIHGYDRGALSGPIGVRRARTGEKLTTLDDVTRDLDPDDLVITDDSGPIGLAGVMGGAATELSASSRDVVIEAAHFEPTTIARTARRHKLASEASRRFERGVDPALPAHAARRTAELLVRLGGGRVEDGWTLVGGPPAPDPITIPADHPATVAGYPIPEAATVRRLEQVGCRLRAREGSLDVAPPPWRPDLVDPNDLAEEVIRLEGYDAVPSVLPAAPPGRGLTGIQRLRRRVGPAVAGAGYGEIITYPFAGPADFDRMELDRDDARRRTVRLANPLSGEQAGMRTTLLTGLLAAAQRNVGRGQQDLALYETGPVFRPRPGAPSAPRPPVDRRPTQAEVAALDAALPDQPGHLGVVLTGAWSPDGWWGSGRPISWADAVEVARLVARTLNVELTVRQGRYAPWHPGRCAELVLDGATGPGAAGSGAAGSGAIGSGAVVGHAGELHPRVCRAFELPERSCATELDLDALLAVAPEVVAALEISAYPVAKEDVALVVPASTPVAEVASALRDGVGPLLESLRLFDVYEGDQVGEGAKSVAFALRLRAPDRTLTDAEVAGAKQAGVDEAARRTGARLRS